MQRHFRDCLRARLREGCWFPLFKRLVGWLNENWSLARRFNNYLAGVGNAPLGAMELYQLVVSVIALVWLWSISSPWHPIFTALPFQFIGFFIAFYFITELFVFSLHWVFVAGGKLESGRRSLATFAVNLFEVAVLFAIVFVLAGCHKGPMDWLTSLYSHLRSVSWLDPVAVREVWTCQVAGMYEDLVAGIIILVIVAGLVGSVTRPEE